MPDKALATTPQPVAVPLEERAARPSSVKLPAGGAKPEPVTAQPAGPQETLEQALTEAYKSNPNLLAARAQLRALDESLPQASAGWKPTVQLSGSYGWSDTHTAFAPTGGATSAFPTNITKSHPYSSRRR